MRHPESGVMVTGCDHKSLTQNKRAAFLRLANHPKFIQWAKIKASGVSLELDKIQEKVDNWMRPEFIKVEYF